jgi:condensin complex subunit 1
MDNIIFRKMQEMIVYPCRSKEWFPLAEQIINTVYALGDHPDVWCDNIIKTFTQRAFASRTPATQEPMIDPMEEDQDPDASRVSDAPTSTPKGSQTIRDPGDAFAMSQLLFVVGHVAIKHIAYLELVEREWKRQKDEKNTGMWIYSCVVHSTEHCTEEKRKAKDSQGPGHKDVDELDQVAGNAEDEIGDRIHLVRETELLYGDHSLLALFGPMIVKICASPHLFKVQSPFYHD